MLIDTHSHLNFIAFNEDRNEIIKKCLENDILIINIGTNFETSKKAVEIAEKYPKGIYATIGLHPINLDTGLVKMKVDEQEGQHFEKEFNYQEYRKLAQNPKVVAIGEIGLDYYWKPKTTKKKELFKEKQKELLLKELELAKELNLPVIFHCRMAHDDLIKTLNTNYLILNTNLKGVMHGFVGTTEQLQEYLKMGFYIGFNGIIFKKVIELRSSSVLRSARPIEGINFEENIKNTPLDRMLIETDCPYLIPPAFPENRNNPLGVKFVVQRIAEIKNISFDKVTEITTENAKKLFNL